MHFRKSIFFVLGFVFILFALRSYVFSQTENYKLILQLEKPSLVLKLYESPDIIANKVGNVSHQDTVVISENQGLWFKVKTYSVLEGWFLYRNGTFWDSDKNTWSESRIVFMDAENKSTVNLNKLFFKNNIMEKLQFLESKLSELETRVTELESRAKALAPGNMKKIQELENRVTELESRLKMQSNRVEIVTQQQPVAKSGPQPPSDDQIKQAIRDFFARKVPPTWAGSTMGGKDAQISSIEIYQIGNYNDRMRYWPVRARVAGTCQANLLARYEAASFDNVGDFKIHQDDYGNWQATMDSF